MTFLIQNGFGVSIEEMSARVAQMERQAATPPRGGGGDDPPLAQVLAELHTALEELRVADEHIRQQQDALMRVHAETEAERRHYAHLFDLAPEGYLVTDINGVIREANRAALSYLNVRAGYLRGKPALNYVALEDRQRIRQHLLALNRPRTDAPSRLEAHIRVTPPHTAPFEAVLHLTGVYNGEADALAAVYWGIQDMTLRNQAEAERYRLLIDAMEDYAVCLMDATGKILQWSRGSIQMFGYEEAEAVGMNLARLFPSDEGYEARLQDDFRDALRDGRKDEADWFVRRDGALLYAEGVLISLRFGVHQGFAKIMRDRTPQKRAQEELLAAYQTTEQVLSSIADGFYAVDDDWLITYVNHKTEELWGKSRSELLGAYLWEVFPGGTNTLAFHEHKRAFRERVPRDFETYMPEQKVWTEVSIYPGASGMSIYFRDVTARKEAEEALGAAHETLEARVAERTADLAEANRRLEREIKARERVEGERRAALARLVDVQEEERRRISREMHDQMGQHLTALSLGLQALKNVASPGDEAAPLLARMQEVTDELGREAHRLAVALRPTSLDDLGLVDALRSHVEEWAARTGVCSEFHAVDTPGTPGTPGTADIYRFLADEVQITLYRVVQEALTNTAKYAHARCVSVLLSCTPDHVLLIVEDDGDGFDTDRVTAQIAPQDGNARVYDASASASADEASFSEPIARRNLGLLGMRERVALVGGTLDIESSPGQGTTLYVRVPILAPTLPG